MKSQIFVSVDVEANGQLTGFNSMLSLGSVAFRVGPNGYEQIATFEANLKELPGGVQDPEVMEWWQDHPDAWAAARVNPEDPEIVMKRYLAWLKALPGLFSMVAYPAAYDFALVHWYLLRFTGEKPFGWSALCSRTYVVCLLREPSWIDFSKKKIPKKYSSDHPHDHTPLNDAIHQAQEFSAMYYKNVIRPWWKFWVRPFRAAS